MILRVCFNNFVFSLLKIRRYSPKEKFRVLPNAIALISFFTRPNLECRYNVVYSILRHFNINVYFF